MNLQTIKGNTKLVGLLGNPVGHSISPQIHNHAFSKLDLNFVYLPLKTEPQNISKAIEGLYAFEFVGANVTIPHKQSVVKYCKELSDISKAIGTVNTLYFKDGNLCGTTTDAIGFYKALESIGCNAEKKNIVILGNGGTARTLAFDIALHKSPESLTIIGRDIKKVKNLCEEVKSKTGVDVISNTFDSIKKENLKNCSLLVNATSVGMFPNVNQSPISQNIFHKDMVVFDAIYNPQETLFLNYAKKAGCKTLNGLKMLLYQGLESFKYWTGVEVNENIFDINELQQLVVNK